MAVKHLIQGTRMVIGLPRRPTLAEAICRCKYELAVTFDVPAKDIIAMHANSVGLSLRQFETKLRGQ